MQRIEKKTITSGRKILENKRQRLLDKKESAPLWWNSSLSLWAREQFGPTLTEKDGATYTNGQKWDIHVCNICGNYPPLDENFIKLDFSFCDEYGCGMNICKNCALKMAEDLQ